MKRSAIRALPVAASVALFATLAVAASCSTSSKSGPVDASAPSDAASCDAGAACTPQSLMGWMPPAYVHAATARPSACPGTYVQDFYTDCLGPSANTQACNGTWYTGADLAHATCVACL